MVRHRIKKKNICIVLTTRGNYAKLIIIIEHLKASANFNLQVVLGGMATSGKFGLIRPLLEKKKIPILYEVDFLVEGQNLNNMVKSSGLAMIEFSNIFTNLNPDIVLLVGDRFETLPIAIASTYMNIPIAHLEGGEVSGSIDESIRHAITKLAHLHFPASVDAERRIVKMGENRNNVHMFGGTSMDILASLDLKNMKPLREYQKKNGIGSQLKLKKKNYLLVIQHPVTTEYDENYKNILETIKVVDELKIETVWILSNVDSGSEFINKAIRVYRENRKPNHIHFYKSLEIELYGPLLNNTLCILGNSSSGIRESSFLGTPAVNIGTRQNGRKSGKNTLHVNYDANQIKNAVRKQMKIKNYVPNFIYGDGMASKKIVKVLEKFDIKNQKLISY